MSALERFLTGVSEDVPPQRARPREFPEAVRTGHPIWSQGVGAFLFPVPGVRFRLGPVTKKFNIKSDETFPGY